MIGKYIFDIEDYLILNKLHLKNKKYVILAVVCEAAIKDRKES